MKPSLSGLFLLLCAATPVQAGERYFVLQSTTSVQNSGLLEHILPLFTAQTGIQVRVVAVGTGQALYHARNGDGDAVLVHDPEAERAFVREGFGVLRCEVARNDFVLVGPRNDPAGIRGLDDVVDAFRRIAHSRALFVSRGDDSGTHRREQALWRQAGIELGVADTSWYRQVGSGMTATLTIAANLSAYTLTDRASFLAFSHRRELEELVRGDPRLENLYAIALVNPERHPRVRFAEARSFRDWLVSPEGQAAIAAFRLGDERAFTPAARCDADTGSRR
ncbi:Tungstate-binding protein TupA [bacterium HR40]|nr:Tungstate-binding protein TupA [bacterium HR40]